jgi:hypothetical protein
MLPAIWPGDVVQIRSDLRNSRSVGDVVLFTRYRRLFAHRVVGCGAGWLVTRGDAVSDCDPPIADSEVLGVVTGIIRGRDFDANDGAAFQPLEAPSLGQRMVAFAIRRSDLVYRIVLKWHRLRAGVPTRVLKVRAVQPGSE